MASPIIPAAPPAPTPTPFNKKQYINYLIALIVGILIFTLGRPGEYLTETGVRVLAILVPTVWIWLTGEMFWSSLLFMGLVVIMQIMPAGAVWESAIGHFAVIMVLVFLLIDGCLNETGALRKVANWFITRKFVEGRPYAFLAMFLGANLFIGIFMQNLALAVMYLALTIKVCESIGIDKKHSLWKIMMLGTLWGNGVLSIASPIAKFFPNFMISFIEANLGFTVSYAMWLAVGIPFTIIMFVIMMICVRLINPDTTPLKNFNVEKFKAENDPPLGKRGKVALIVFVILLGVILIPDIILIGGATGAVANAMRYITGLSATVPAIVAIAALCLLRAEGKPIMDINAAIGNVKLGFILFLAAVIFAGTVVGLPDANIGPWMGSMLEPLVGGLPDFLTLAILVVLAITLSQFLGNVVVLVLFLTLGIPLFTDAGAVTQLTYAILMSYSIMIAVATPPAVVTAALYYGPDHIRAGDVAKQNILFIAFAVIGILIMTPIVGAVLG